MAVRQVKCRVCLNLDDKALMDKQKEGYVHLGECLNKYIEHKRFKEEEKIQWDKLYKYIISLHNIIVLPKSNVIRLQALRNGEDIQNGQKVKKYKTGAEYDLIYDAYILAENDIKWCIINKLSGSNDIKAINYCISIMISKLNEAWIRRRNRQRQVEEMGLHQTEIESKDVEYTYQSKSSNNDISEFL